MGQYYKPTVITEDGMPIVHANPWDMFTMGKITEQANIIFGEDSSFLTAIVSYLFAHPNSRVVWAGDYADGTINVEGQDEPINIYQANTEFKVKQFRARHRASPLYKYVINTTKKEFYDKDATHSDLFPLALLTADGNGRGGGDYFGPLVDLVGRWKGDKITLSNDKPAGGEYTEISPEFKL